VPEVPNWHPNLRIVESLPDTKVVRTAFFVNGGFGVLALIALGYFLVQEWKLHEVNSQIADLEHQIDQGTHQSNDAVRLYKDFKVEAAKTDEVADFVSSRPLLSNIILRLGEITPKNIALDSLDFKENGLSIRATIKGAADKATLQIAPAFERLLRADPKFGAKFSEVNLVTIVKNNAGRMKIDILCTYRKEKK